MTRNHPFVAPVLLLTACAGTSEAHAPTGVLEGAISPKGEKYGAEASALVEYFKSL